MKALVRDRYGPPDVLRFEELTTPEPTADQVLVRVAAASLNAADLDHLYGRPAAIRLATGLRRPRNRRIGVDVAGRVEAVGESVTRFRIGDEVFADLFAHGMGSLATHVCASERAFLPKPGSMTAEEAATLPHSAILAIQGLRAGRPIRADDRLLINGASGNVGPFAIQLAKARGMHVTGVASGPKLDFVRSIGADEAIDYSEVSYSRIGRRWDRILDVSASRSLFEVRRALASDGVYTWIGGTTGTLAQALLFSAATSLSRQRMGMTFSWKPFDATDVATLIELFEAGALKPIIDRRLTLDDAIEGLRYVDDGHARGKLVVKVA